MFLEAPIGVVVGVCSRGSVVEVVRCVSSSSAGGRAGDNDGDAAARQLSDVVDVGRWSRASAR